MQTADCRPDTKCRLGTKCRLQTAEWVENADWESKEFFRLVWNNTSSYNLPSVTQSLSAIRFHDYLHYCGIVLAHILDQNRSWCNFKPSCSLLTLRATWLVWCLCRFYQRNKSRCRCRFKWDVTIEYLTRATFEKQLCTWSVLSFF